MRVVWVLVVVAVAARAQGPGAVRLGVADGLAQGSVYAVAQDTRGFVWLGTHGGLDRFDGAELRPHRRGGPGTLSGNRIHTLVPAPDGGLWVLTTAGLDRLDPRSGRFEPWGRVAWPTVAAPRRGGGVWVASPDGLLVAAADGPGLRRVLRGVSVHAVLDDGARVWLGTDRGLRACDPRTGRLVVPRGLPAGLAAPVRALLRTRDGGLWASTDAALFRRRLGAAAFEPVRGVAGASALAEDRRGRVWVGGDGVRILDPARGTAEALRVDGAPLRSHVASLAVDREGGVWVGTDPDGAVYVAPEVPPPPFAPLDVGLADGESVTALAAGPGGRVWVGTLRGGLRWAEGDRRGAVAGPGSPVRALHAAPDGTLWVGADGGLTEIAPDGARRPHPLPFGDAGTSAVSAVVAARDGGLWVGARLGLYRVRPGRPAERVGVGATEALVEARDGTLWVGTKGNGLVRLGPSGDAEAVALPGETVLALAEDRRGRVWAGTEDGLVAVDPATGRAVRYAEGGGLPSAFVFSLVEDPDGALWVGTTRGVARVDAGAEPAAIRAFGAADGLRSVEMGQGAALRAPDGAMLFGGAAVERLRPGALRDEPPGPPVAFTGLSLFDDPADPGLDLNGGRTLRLDHADGVVTIAFAGLVFSGGERVRYAYRMDGVDPGWVDAGARREARYTRLPPGAHTFRVRAARGGGPWGPERALAVEVAPPWWLTGWALGLGALGAAGGVAGATRAVVGRRLRRQLRAAEARRALEAALADDRARIADDVHDNVGATLTQIQLLSEATRRGAADPDALDRIAAAARRATEDLDAIVWAVDPARDVPEAFADYLCGVAEEMCHNAGLRCRIDRPDAWPDLRLPAEARFPALLVVREALCNAAKHGRAGTVYLTLAADGDRVRIEVADDGRGFDPAAACGQGNGLRTMAARAERAGGRLVVDSALGRGTRVRLELPARA